MRIVYSMHFLISSISFKADFMRSFPNRIQEPIFGRPAEEILYHYHVMGSTIDNTIPGANTAVWRAIFRFHNPKGLNYAEYRAEVSPSFIQHNLLKLIRVF